MIGNTMSSTTTVPSPNAFGTAIPQQQQQQAHSQSAASSATVSLSVPAAPGPTPSVQLGKDADISSTKALKQSFVKTNPIYANSFGAQAFERTTSYGLKIIGWRVIGKAQQRWQRLEPSLLSLLVSKREVLYSKRPPGLIMDPPCALRCFLLGPDKDHATPYATVLCGMPWLRKAMGKLVTKSGLLIPDGFECCGLPDKPELYGRVDSGEDSGVRSRFEKGSVFPGERDQMKQLPGTAAMRQLDGFDMQYILESGVANGRDVEIYHNDIPIGGATIGGVITIGDKRFEMTVRHVFRPPPLPLGRAIHSVLNDTSDVKDPSGLEIDLFDSDSESEHISDTDEEPEGNRRTVHARFRTRRFEDNTIGDNEPDLVLFSPRMPYSPPGSGTSHGGSHSASVEKAKAVAQLSEDRGTVSSDSQTFNILGSQSDDGRSPESSPSPERETDEHPATTHSKGAGVPSMLANIRPSPERPILAPPDLELDWALREVASGSSVGASEDFMLRSNVPFADFDEFAGPDQVLIKTSSRLKVGTPDSTGIIGPIPINDSLSIPPQRVHVVSLAKDSQIIPGECGSWAMNRHHKFTGMLIGSCPSLGEAYLLPLRDILDDISEQTGLEAEVEGNMGVRSGRLQFGSIRSLIQALGNMKRGRKR